MAHRHGGIFNMLLTKYLFNLLRLFINVKILWIKLWYLLLISYVCDDNCIERKANETESKRSVSGTELQPDLWSELTHVQARVGQVAIKSYWTSETDRETARQTKVTNLFDRFSAFQIYTLEIPLGSM